MHQTDPARVLLHARALGVLPREVRLVGCQPAVVDGSISELSPAVARAVPQAERIVRALIRDRVPDPDAVRRRDEVLQVMYWMRGERLGEDAGVSELRIFVEDDGTRLGDDLLALLVAGWLEPAAGEDRYRLTTRGEAEAARRFADTFAELTRQAHGACSDPNCECHTLGPEACTRAVR
jgi:hypothetical protein